MVMEPAELILAGRPIPEEDFPKAQHYQPPKKRFRSRFFS
jgi:hypothetical protein